MADIAVALKPISKGLAARIIMLQDRGLYDLIASVARHHGPTIEEIFSQSRQKNLVLARHSVWKALALRGLSPEQIAKATGHDPSTVREALKDKPKPKTHDRVLRESIAAIDAAIEALRVT